MQAEKKDTIGKGCEEEALCPGAPSRKMKSGDNR
jgi:hypothetical protein